MKRFLFSTKANLATGHVLQGLAAAHLVTATSCIVVVTEDDQVAALLEKLDTAEQIEAAIVQDLPAASSSANQPVYRKASPAITKRHYRYNGGEKVECPKCHNKVSPMFMLKDGSQCKICSMKAKKAVKSQQPEKSQPHSALLPKPEFGHEDNLSNIRDRQKEKLDLSKLSGVKVG